MRNLEEIKNDIKAKHICDIEDNIINALNNPRNYGKEEKSVYYTIDRLSPFMIEIGEEVVKEVKDAGYKIEVLEEIVLSTRYKITL